MEIKHLSKEELESGLANILDAPDDNGRLELVVRRPEENEREVLLEGELDLELGLVGDNWRTRGSSRTTNGLGHPDMQLNIMNARVAELIAVSPERRALCGDQLYIDMNLSDENLPPGSRLSIGDAVVEITEIPHNGCKKFAERFGVEAVKFVNSPKGKEFHLRGLNAKVVKPGKIKQGTIVSKVTE